MAKNKTIGSHFKHLLMSVTLLWALLLNGQEVTAYGLQAQEAQSTPATHVANKPEKEERSVVKQKISLEATTSFITLNLQQVIEPDSMPGFAKPSDELLPLYATTIPGSTFVALLFPITIQPQAP
jgi:hypothetical protein